MRPATSPSGGEGHHAIALFGVTNGGEKALLKGCDHDPDDPDDLRGDEKEGQPREGVHQPFQGDFSAEGGGGGVAPAVT